MTDFIRKMSKKKNVKRWKKNVNKGKKYLKGVQ